MKKSFCLLLFVSILGVSSQAQRGWEVGGWGGVAHYFGDLNSNFNLNDPGVAAGAIFRYNFNNRVCLKFGANYANVSGDDADSKNTFEQARNLSFQSTIIDGTAQLEFNFLPYVHGSRDEFYTPYVFAGFTAFYFNPKAELNGDLVELRPLGTEGQFKGEEYYTVQGGLAYGIGFKLDLSYEWSLNFELGARQLFTDYLDDVSTVYPDLDDLAKIRGPLAAELSDRSIPVPGVDGNIGEEGRQRGNSANNDSYVMLGVGLVYYFGDLRCPTYGKRK